MTDVTHGDGTVDDPWVLRTPSGTSTYTAWRDESADPPALVVQVGSTRLSYLLRGLDDDLCHSPHWGYLAAGTVLVEYVDSTTERVRAGEVFFWPAGHTVLVEQDAELVMFSPAHEHGQVMDHIAAKVAAMA